MTAQALTGLRISLRAANFMLTIADDDIGCLLQRCFWRVVDREWWCGDSRNQSAHQTMDPASDQRSLPIPSPGGIITGKEAT